MTEIIKLIDYHTWATNLITDQLLGLPEEMITKQVGGSFPSIRLTMEHLMSADYIWMNRWKGVPYVDPPADWGDLKTMIGAWRDVQAQLTEAARVLAQRPEDKFKFTTRKGARYELPFYDIVLHMTNHGTYHRGQIANMIRMLGERPVATDYFLFCVQ